MRPLEHMTSPAHACWPLELYSNGPLLSDLRCRARDGAKQAFGGRARLVRAALCLARMFGAGSMRVYAFGYQRNDARFVLATTQLLIASRERPSPYGAGDGSDQRLLCYAFARPLFENPFDFAAAAYLLDDRALLTATQASSADTHTDLRYHVVSARPLEVDAAQADEAGDLVRYVGALADAAYTLRFHALQAACERTVPVTSQQLLDVVFARGTLSVLFCGAAAATQQQQQQSPGGGGGGVALRLLECTGAAGAGAPPDSVELHRGPATGRLVYVAGSEFGQMALVRAGGDVFVCGTKSTNTYTIAHAGGAPARTAPPFEVDFLSGDVAAVLAPADGTARLLRLNAAYLRSLRAPPGPPGTRAGPVLQVRLPLALVLRAYAAMLNFSVCPVGDEPDRVDFVFQCE